MKSSHFVERGLIVQFRISINFGRLLKISTQIICNIEVRIPSLNLRAAPISLLIAPACPSKISNKKITLNQTFRHKRKVRRKFLKSFSKYGPTWNISKIIWQRRILSRNQIIIFKMIIWMRGKMKLNFSMIFLMKLMKT